jgi:hypothetical protein
MMAVYVDMGCHQYGRMRMCHMMADSPVELHAMADRIGIARRWFQDSQDHPHYDICQSKKRLALSLGAVEVDSHRLVELIREQRARRMSEK